LHKINVQNTLLTQINHPPQEDVQIILKPLKFSHNSKFFVYLWTYWKWQKHLQWGKTVPFCK